MPSAVANWTVDVALVAPVKVTVNTALAVPEAGLVTVGSVIAKPGAETVLEDRAGALQRGRLGVRRTRQVEEVRLGAGKRGAGQHLHGDVLAGRSRGERQRAAGHGVVDSGNRAIIGRREVDGRGQGSRAGERDGEHFVHVS